MKIKSLSIIAVLFLSVVLFSCGNTETNTDTTEDNNAEETNNTENNNTEEFANEEFAFTEMSISKNDVPADLYKGTWHSAKKWSDKNGENIFVISIYEKKHDATSELDPSLTREIHGYHYVTNGENTLIREIKDFVNKCEFANELHLVENSFTLTDLNNDNYGEICFVYHLDCSSEASANEIKLMFLENGDKYAIRGTTTMPGGIISEKAIQGKTNIGADMKNAPVVFLNYAKETWDKAQNNSNDY